MPENGASSVVIAGGGVAALEAALALRELAQGALSVELLAPEPHFWYRPLAVAEPFGLGETTRFELGDLAARAGASVSPGSLVAVDAERRLAFTSVGTAVPYGRAARRVRGRAEAGRPRRDVRSAAPPTSTGFAGSSTSSRPGRCGASRSSSRSGPCGRCRSTSSR